MWGKKEPRFSEQKELEVPLLADGVPYPNCPGCKCAHFKANGAGPPFKELLMISFVVLCNAIPISSLYPFLYFMVEDFHIAKTTEDIGYYAGALASIFMAGRVISSVPWGVFADKYGRRPVFFLGLLSIIVLQPIFGMSNNFWVAFLTRFLLGTFNGMLGPLKAYVSELCNAENQAWGLTVVSTCWSLGLIIGPAMGGFLSRPVLNYPWLFSENSLFARYPYLLPSLCQAWFAFFVLGVVCYLPETIHKHDEEVVETDVEQTVVARAKPEKSSLWLNWPLMASVAVYCSWSLHEISFNEIFSMWCVSPLQTGGLSLLTSDVGTILAISGFGMLCVQLAIFPPLAKYFGPTLVTRTPAILTIPLVLLFPVAPLLYGNVQWFFVTILALLRNILSTMVFTGSFLMVNNAVTNEQRGAANGISLCCVSIFRAIGPATGGAIFAWGQSRHDTKILPGSQMVFVVLDVICVLALFTMFPPFLPAELNEPCPEPMLQHSLIHEADHVDEEEKKTDS